MFMVDIFHLDIYKALTRTTLPDSYIDCRSTSRPNYYTSIAVLAQQSIERASGDTLPVLQQMAFKHAREFHDKFESEFDCSLDDYSLDAPWMNDEKRQHVDALFNRLSWYLDAAEPNKPLMYLRQRQVVEAYAKERPGYLAYLDGLSQTTPYPLLTLSEAVGQAPLGAYIKNHHDRWEQNIWYQVSPDNGLIYRCGDQQFPCFSLEARRSDGYADWTAMRYQIFATIGQDTPL